MSGDKKQEPETYEVMRELARYLNDAIAAQDWKAVRQIIHQMHGESFINNAKSYL